MELNGEPNADNLQNSHEAVVQHKEIGPDSVIDGRQWVQQ